MQWGFQAEGRQWSGFFFSLWMKYFGWQVIAQYYRSTSLHIYTVFYSCLRHWWALKVSSEILLWPNSCVTCSMCEQTLTFPMPGSPSPTYREKEPNLLTEQRAGKVFCAKCHCPDNFLQAKQMQRPNFINPSTYYPNPCSPLHCWACWDLYVTVHIPCCPLSCMLRVSLPAILRVLDLAAYTKHVSNAHCRNSTGINVQSAD